MSGTRDMTEKAQASDVVLWLGEKERCAGLKRLVAGHCRLVEVPAGAAAPGVERFGLVAENEHAAAALRLALDQPQKVAAVVLLAPTIFDARGAAREADASIAERLGAIEAPVLALFGTRDSIAPPEAARHYRARNARCNLVFVYDAGAAMGEERPEAVAELVTDFLRRRDRFIVRQHDDLLYR
jgi:pimeloyl-ACP methyl ester carboxylesterase